MQLTVEFRCILGKQLLRDLRTGIIKGRELFEDFQRPLGIPRSPCQLGLDVQPGKTQFIIGALLQNP